jgi:cytochrome c peroxidase
LTLATSAFAIACAAALLLTACGGGGDVEPDTADSGHPEQATERAMAALFDGRGEQQNDAALAVLAHSQRPELAQLSLAQGRRLFERETFGGNGRTCLTCHSRETGTTSPQDAQARFARNPADPLFVADGSDDGQGHGASRMQADATVLVRVNLPPNVSLADDPAARSVVLRRGIPSTLNTPALDPVLMLDGRQPDLMAQAAGAIADHAQATLTPTAAQLRQIAAFQQTPGFFSSLAMLKYAYLGRTPTLPECHTESEQRGRRFFVDAPPEGDFKTGLCAGCHSGPLLNETNQFVPAPPFKRGGRFQSVGVSEFNPAGHPVREFLFRNADGSSTSVRSPDPGRALVTGRADDPESLNAFKTPSLWGVARTAPYFHDNSAKTLEDVAAHYARFFGAISPVQLSAQDQADIVAYLKLLR